MNEPGMKAVIPGRSVSVARGVRRCVRTALVVVCVLLPCTVEAQEVRGVVVDSATSAPLSGVLVSILDATGERVRASLTDERGGFSMELPLGRYRLRAERIGLRPESTAPFDLDTFRPRDVEIRMTDRAVRIAGLTVDARVQSCRLDPEGAVRIQRWWREVRTALDVSAVLQRQRFAEFRIEKFEREWDVRLRRIVAENRRVELGTSSRPFVSEEAAYLAEGGYVQGDIRGQRQYFAPDADVLLSDIFLAGHCFSVAESEEDEHALGLRFEPTRERTVPDIEGTLWVDTTTAELQRLDFRYTGVEEVPESESGGMVSFEYLPSGAWVVSEWYIRMPRVAEDLRRRNRFEVVGYVDVGGRVSLQETERAVPRPGVAGAIRGLVYDSIRGFGLPDARVTILGTDLEAPTDAAGEFILTNVPVGRHGLTFSHPDPETWGLASSLVEVEVRERLTSDVRLAIPSFRQAALALCLGEGLTARTALVGHVLGRDRRPLPRLPLQLAWRPADGPSDGAPRRVPTSTDSDGRYVACLLPAGAHVTVRVQLDGRWVDAFEVVMPEARVTYREIWLTRG